MGKSETEEDLIWAKMAFVFYVACVRPVKIVSEESPWPPTVEQAQRLLSKDEKRLYDWLVKDRWTASEELRKR